MFIPASNLLLKEFSYVPFGRLCPALPNIGLNRIIRARAGWMWKRLIISTSTTDWQYVAATG